MSFSFSFILLLFIYEENVMLFFSTLEQIATDEYVCVYLLHAFWASQ
jgi:hypothetical protein